MAGLSFNLFLLSCFPTFALLCFTTTAFTTTPTITKPQRYVTKLIHHDSVHSPYYNPMATISDQARHAIDSSRARLAYLRAKAQGFSLATDDVRAGVIAKTTSTGFLANISIGEPPSPQLLIVDTGSSLSWTQCQPCSNTCFPQAVPVFDPSKSSTFMRAPCSSAACLASPGNQCDKSVCTFKQGYASGTIITGLVATEKLTFETSDEGTISVPNIDFGCSNKVSGIGGQSSGILGLGSDQVSLASQLGSKFSYCFGSIRDPQYSYNQLIFGDGAKVEGPSTPLEILGGLYFLTLQGISVAGNLLNISFDAFKRTPSNSGHIVPSSHGGVIIDSGTTFTVLTRGGFDPLNAEVRSLTSGFLGGAEGSTTSAPCYTGIINRDLAWFPMVTFHFANGVDLDLDVESMFFQESENEFCMAVLPSDIDDVSIIGVVAQQGYNVAYDLRARTLSLQRMGCELLEG